MPHERHLPWTAAGRDLFAGRRRPLWMGILNVTPDSFSDGGRHDALDAAVRHAHTLAAEGADILDVGGESTRPGSEPVSEEEERRRVLPVIERLAEEVDVPISIDTTKAAVAKACLAAGATIVNDVSGLTFDPAMTGVCAESDAAVVAMHIRGRPASMQDDIQYAGDDVLAAVRRWNDERVAALTDAGISPDRIATDPGIGFGKTAEHNLTLLRSIRTLRSFGRPVLIGHSRKRFLGRLLRRPVEERLAGTIGVSIAAADAGADIIRVHDVAANRDAVDAFRAVSDDVMNP